MLEIPLSDRTPVLELKVPAIPESAGAEKLRVSPEVNPEVIRTSAEA
jgi:hypothetical protein